MMWLRKNKKHIKKSRHEGQEAHKEEMTQTIYCILDQLRLIAPDLADTEPDVAEGSCITTS